MISDTSQDFRSVLVELKRVVLHRALTIDEIQRVGTYSKRGYCLAERALLSMEEALQMSLIYMLASLNAHETLPVIIRSLKGLMGRIQFSLTDGRRCPDDMLFLELFMDPACNTDGLIHESGAGIFFLPRILLNASLVYDTNRQETITSGIGTNREKSHPGRRCELLLGYFFSEMVLSVLSPRSIAQLLQHVESVTAKIFRGEMARKAGTALFLVDLAMSESKPKGLSLNYIMTFMASNSSSPFDLLKVASVEAGVSEWAIRARFAEFILLVSSKQRSLLHCSTLFHNFVPERYMEKVEEIASSSKQSVSHPYQNSLRDRLLDAAYPLQVYQSFLLAKNQLIRAIQLTAQVERQTSSVRHSSVQMYRSLIDYYFRNNTLMYATQRTVQEMHCHAFVRFVGPIGFEYMIQTLHQLINEFPESSYSKEERRFVRIESEKTILSLLVYKYGDTGAVARFPSFCKSMPVLSPENSILWAERFLAGNNPLPATINVEAGSDSTPRPNLYKLFCRSRGILDDIIPDDSDSDMEDTQDVPASGSSRDELRLIPFHGIARKESQCEQGYDAEDSFDHSVTEDDHGETGVGEMNLSPEFQVESPSNRMDPVTEKENERSTIARESLEIDPGYDAEDSQGHTDIDDRPVHATRTNMVETGYDAEESQCHTEEEEDEEAVIQQRHEELAHLSRDELTNMGSIRQAIPSRKANLPAVENQTLSDMSAADELTTGLDEDFGNESSELEEAMEVRTDINEGSLPPPPSHRAPKRSLIEYATEAQEEHRLSDRYTHTYQEGSFNVPETKTSAPPAFGGTSSSGERVVAIEMESVDIRGIRPFGARQTSVVSDMALSGDGLSQGESIASQEDTENVDHSQLDSTAGRLDSTEIVIDSVKVGKIEETKGELPSSPSVDITQSITVSPKSDLHYMDAEQRGISQLHDVTEGYRASDCTPLSKDFQYEQGKLLESDRYRGRPPLPPHSRKRLNDMNEDQFAESDDVKRPRLFDTNASGPLTQHHIPGNADTPAKEDKIQLENDKSSHSMKKRDQEAVGYSETPKNKRKKATTNAIDSSHGDDAPDSDNIDERDPLVKPETNQFTLSIGTEPAENPLEGGTQEKGQIREDVQSSCQDALASGASESKTTLPKPDSATCTEGIPCPVSFSTEGPDAATLRKIPGANEYEQPSFSEDKSLMDAPSHGRKSRVSTRRAQQSLVDDLLPSASTKRRTRSTASDADDDSSKLSSATPSRQTRSGIRSTNLSHEEEGPLSASTSTGMATRRSTRVLAKTTERSISDSPLSASSRATRGSVIPKDSTAESRVEGVLSTPGLPLARRSSRPAKSATADENSVASVSKNIRPARSSARTRKAAKDEEHSIASSVIQERSSQPSTPAVERSVVDDASVHFARSTRQTRGSARAAKLLSQDDVSVASSVTSRKSRTSTPVVVKSVTGHVTRPISPTRSTRKERASTPTAKPATERDDASVASSTATGGGTTRRTSKRSSKLFTDVAEDSVTSTTRGNEREAEAQKGPVTRRRAQRK